jgi:anion-transporting  ArsA/GET3 family ATPase
MKRTEPPTATATAVLDSRSVVVCVGAGGVGKTTTAAALALQAARRGRRTCVVTIDPARRLSDAMGLDGDDAIDNEPRRVDIDIDINGSGELWAVMLDTAITFDALIRTYALSDAQAETILTNRFYRNIADSMGGAHEYMAMEKLYELHNDDRFDLVIVDTPPSTNAIEFLEAPNRITRFLDHRLYKVLVTPSGGLARAMNFAAQAFLRTVARIVGGSVVDDAIEFLAAFDGMEDGFRARATAVQELLRAEDTTFVLVTVPRRDTVDDAVDFVERLDEAGIEVDTLIANRVHPKFTHRTGRDFDRHMAALDNMALAPFATVLRESNAISTGEEASLARLTAALGDATVIRVPFLDADVHDLAGLDRITRWLGGSAPTR